VTASGGSDLPWGGTIGETRVYSYLGQQPFSADAWFEAFARGRTFTTSGPMIEFTVDEARPGDELQVQPGRQLRVRARAWADPNSTLPVRLEIVRHGEVIRSAVSPDSRRDEVSLDFTLEAANGFWIAARASTGIGTSAHTTPVYVVREGLRFWKYEALAELIAKRLDSLAQIERIVGEVRSQDHGARLLSDRNKKQLAVDGPELLERVVRARNVYAELGKTAEHERGRRNAQTLAKLVTSDPPGWKRVVEQNFPVANEFSRWRLEGSAAVTVTMFRTLNIETRRGHIQGADTSASALWFDEPLTGDVRLEFDARADLEARPSLFFNARPRDGGGSLFDSRRPHAREGDYGDSLELYALEILRAGQPSVELKHLGGPKPTTLATASNPFSTDPEKVYHFDVRVSGPRVVVWVDGRVVFDVINEARKDRPLAGGYFGFHNAHPGGMSFDNVRAYRADRASN
jgi:hypothetical protein